MGINLNFIVKSWPTKRAEDVLVDERIVGYELPKILPPLWNSVWWSGFHTYLFTLLRSISLFSTHACILTQPNLGRKA